MPLFDHEKLDVYRVGLEFVTLVFRLVSGLDGPLRHARDQIIRSSQSIILNIAEGNGKRSPGERRRFLEIARGSAMESAATLDILAALGACPAREVEQAKALLVRVVAMLSRMTQMDASSVREEAEGYGETSERDYEHDYEHEHDIDGIDAMRSNH